MISLLNKYKNITILFFVLIFSFFLLTFKITKVPPGINGDESGIGYNAILISKNLTDENNNFLPLFIFAKESDWKQPVSVYSTSLVFKILGVSFFNLRLTSVFFVLISLVLFYFLSKELYDFKFFLIGSLILITTPILMVQSHLALENITVLPFILFWLLMLVRFEKIKKPVYLLLAGLSLGVGIYSYLGMRLIVPILTFLTLILLRKKIKQWVYFLLGVIPLFILLYIANLYYPGAVVGNYNAPPPSINQFLLRYLSSFDLSFLFLKGDVTPYHSTGTVGMFLVPSLPLFIMGIVKILKEKRPFEVFILSSFFLTPFLFGFVPELYRASRLISLIPFFVIISTLGYFYSSNKFRIAILFLLIINYIYFVNDYWFKYPERVKHIFPVKIEQTHEFLLKK